MVTFCKVRIVCISDTHNHAPGEGFTLPRGDILIHAGDLTNQGSSAELIKSIRWISEADFAVKIVIAGNHDTSLDEMFVKRKSENPRIDETGSGTTRDLVVSDPNIIYLAHAAATVNIPKKKARLKVFGSPYSQKADGRGDWAFQYATADAGDLWSAVPPDTDILITHTPPHGFCDSSHHWSQGGCPVLTMTVRKIRPLLHICGHCHEGRGACVVTWSDDDQSVITREWHDPGAGNKKQSLLDLTGSRSAALERTKETAIINASIMAVSHSRTGKKAFNKPIVVDVLLPVID